MPTDPRPMTDDELPAWLLELCDDATEFRWSGGGEDQPHPEPPEVKAAPTAEEPEASHE